MQARRPRLVELPPGADHPLQPVNSGGCWRGAGLEKAEFSPPILGMTRAAGLGGDRRLASGGVAGGGSGEDGTELLGEAGISAPGFSRFMRWCRRHFARLLENHTCVVRQRTVGMRTRGARACTCSCAAVRRELTDSMLHFQQGGISRSLSMVY